MRGKRCRNRDSFRKTAGTRLYFKIRCIFHFNGWLLEWNLIGVKLGNQNKFLFLLRVIKSTESCKPHHNSKLTSVEIYKATRKYTHYKLIGATFSQNLKSCGLCIWWHQARAAPLKLPDSCHLAAGPIWPVSDSEAGHFPNSPGNWSQVTGSDRLSVTRILFIFKYLSWYRNC